MILCGAATCLPLLIGLAMGQLMLAIYGALCGYLLALNDSAASLPKRLWTTTLTFFLLVGGFGGGWALQGQNMGFLVTLGMFAYWLGVFGGEGAELERGLLFGLIGLVIAHSTSALPSAVLLQLGFYALISYVCVLVGVSILALTRARDSAPVLGLRESFIRSLSKKREKHIHAVSYAFAVLLSVWATEFLQIERGYWVTVTVLLVMKPDRTQSLYKTSQRLFGTALAMLVCDLIIEVAPRLPVFIGLVVMCAFTVPWALKRNYWLVAFFVTIMVVFLLEMAATDHGSIHIPFLRLKATLIGCVFSVIGTLVAKIIDTLFQRR